MLIKSKTIKITITIIAISALTLFATFYLIPNIFGYVFLSGEVLPVTVCNELVGIRLIVDNSYFMPIILTYPGADLVVDIFDEHGSKVYRASFLSESLHDEEEGYTHVAKLSSGVSPFVLT